MKLYQAIKPAKTTSSDLGFGEFHLLYLNICIQQLIFLLVLQHIHGVFGIYYFLCVQANLIKYAFIDAEWMSVPPYYADFPPILTIAGN